MQVTGIREFRSKATSLLSGRELVFVTRHGKLAGLVVPVAEPLALPVDLRRDLLARMGEALSRHLRHAGVTERRALRDFKAWRASRRPRRG